MTKMGKGSVLNRQARQACEENLLNSLRPSRSSRLIPDLRRVLCARDFALKFYRVATWVSLLILHFPEQLNRYVFGNRREVVANAVQDIEINVESVFLQTTHK